MKQYPFQSLKLDCHSHHGWSHCFLLLWNYFVTDITWLRTSRRWRIFILRHLFSWFCLDVTDVQMSPMSWCHQCLDVAELRISPRCLVFPPWRRWCHWYHDPGFQQIAPGLLIDPPPLLDDLCGRHHFSAWLHLFATGSQLRSNYVQRTTLQSVSFPIPLVLESF